MESPAAAKTLTPARTKYFRKVKVSTFLVVMPFGFRWRHPERSRFSGGERDLARITVMLLARSLRPLEQTRAFGMTPEVQDSLSDLKVSNFLVPAGFHLETLTL